MARFQFQRESRTSHSEAYVVYAEDRPVGRVDLHYGPDLVNGTICVPEDFSEDDIQELIGEVDDRLAMSANPIREDLVVTVWLGRQAGVYSEETEGEAAKEAEGNGQVG